jgi:hypothetical protein
MTSMGRYCKAFPARRFREYAGWVEDCGHLRTDAAGARRNRIEDDDVLYLQENYTVTDGLYKDENVVFAEVTGDWVRFCAEVLAFRLPDDATSVEGPPDVGAAGARHEA